MHSAWFGSPALSPPAGWRPRNGFLRRNGCHRGGPQALVLPSAHKPAATGGQKSCFRPHAGGPFHPGTAGTEEAGAFASSQRTKARAPNLFRSHRPAAGARAGRVVRPEIREKLSIGRGITRRSTPGQPALWGTLGTALARRGALRRQRRTGKRCGTGPRLITIATSSSAV